MKLKYYYLAPMLITFVSLASHSENKKINLVSYENPPYYSKNLKKKGFLTHIISESFQKAGYTVNVDFKPFKRAYQEARSGIYDGIFTLWYRKEREQWFHYSPPININEIGFFKHRDLDIKYETIDDLRKYKIGVVRGYSYAKSITKAGLDLEEVTTPEQNLLKLIKRRIHLVLADKTVSKYHINKNHSDMKNSFQWITPALEKINQQLAISKKTKNSKKKMSDFVSSYNTLLKSGRVAAIKKKYGY